MKQTELRLKESDRLALEMLRSKGVHLAREVNRAHVLMALDAGVPEATIRQVLGLGRTVLWRTRAAYHEGGLEYALHDEPRSGQPRKYQTDQEAEVVALACSAPPGRVQALDRPIAHRRRPATAGVGRRQSGDYSPDAKKNDCKPWRKLMWCVGRITAEYRKRMYGLLRIYARPYNAKEPVVCVDEKSKQLLRQTQSPLALQPGRPAKEDYEYQRAGTRNIFMAVEPKGGRRVVEVTTRRAKEDFVSFVKHLVENVYAAAETIHLVLDNLNTHFRKTFVDVLGKAAATVLLRRVTFHHTPKHASWLNMAEIEIGIMDRQCTGQRIATVELLQTEVESWQQQRNAAKRGIEWKFTRQDADRKLSKHYVP